MRAQAQNLGNPESQSQPHSGELLCHTPQAMLGGAAVTMPPRQTVEYNKTCGFIAWLGAQVRREAVLVKNQLLWVVRLHNAQDQ